MKIKRIAALVVATLFATSIYANGLSTESSVDAAAQKEKKSETTTTGTKAQTVKKGWNFAPFPSVGYNSDTGFQMGALIIEHCLGVTNVCDISL